MDAEDGDEEQRHQADALQAPGAVLSRPGIESSSVSCTSVLLAWGPVEAGSDSRPFCCYFSLYFLCPDLIIKVRIILALQCNFWTGLECRVFTK